MDTNLSRLSSSPSSSLIASLTATFSEHWRHGDLDIPKKSYGSKKRARTSEYEGDDNIHVEDVKEEENEEEESSTTSSILQLRRRFESFFESLLALLGKKEASVGATNDMLDLKIKALDSIVHFMAHANSLKSQRDQGGASLCWPIVLQVLTHFLCAGGRGASISSNTTIKEKSSGEKDKKGSRSSSSLNVFLFSDLSSSLLAFKEGYCDDYDDIRYAVFRAIKELCGVKLALVDSSSSSLQSQSSGGGVLANQLLSACDVNVFTRNCAEILLLLSLPSSQAEWDEVQHTSFAVEEITPFLVKAAQRDQTTSSSESTQVPPVRSSTPKYFMLSEQLRANGEAWLSLLRLPLPQDVQRRVLLAIPSRVLPFMTDRQPLLLADFLTDALKTPSGATPLLALQSLFTLMIRYGLDFPNFYPRLYELLSTDTAHAKYRSKFFQQLDSFLSSPVLPAYVAASFAKRLARISLVSPLGVALFAVPAVYNLVRRHPQILPLLHRSREGSIHGITTTSSSTQSKQHHQWPSSSDPFNAETNDPFATRAIESSLWELTALQTHYYAPIASLARSLAISTMPAPLTVGVGASSTLPEAEGANSPLLARPDFDVSRYLDVTSSTYASIAQNELSREVKKAGGKTALADIAFEFKRSGGGSGSSSLFEEEGSVCSWRD